MRTLPGVAGEQAQRYGAALSERYGLTDTRLLADDQVPRPARRATNPDFRYGAMIGYPDLRSPYRTDGSR